MHALFSTCDLCDAHRDALHSNELRVLPPVFRSYGKISRFRGQVATIQCRDDNALLRATLESAGMARVLVVDGAASMKRALLGGNLAALANQNGWAGVVINGCVRDVNEIQQVPVGVLALAAMPAPPDKQGHGMADAVVNIQDVIVRPGEWLYADEDGVIVSREQLGLAL
ncbi:MAG: ribonuclease E activity regulator RraA [Thiomonas sp.]|nr:ribonuclease E activity regulator RraA [Thiomonas sp.]